jgi:cytochrome c oxidase cbb3-type subunit I/II
MYGLRAIGGTLFIIGASFGAYNLWKTARQGSFEAEEVDEAQAIIDPAAGTNEKWHRRLEGRPLQFTALTLVVILIGGIIEYVPTALVDSNVPTIASVKPYTPLEIEGRDIYIAEGCNNCHSQMIRPFRSETERYGEYSKAGEFVYDHPFLWGSKRTGPDLHRIGGKYPDSWHVRHMYDPTSTSPGSIMPAYPWMFTQKADIESIPNRISALRTVGVPYAEGYEELAIRDYEAQANSIVNGLKQNGFGEIEGIEITSDSKIVAMIAYLQRMGIDIKGNKNPWEDLPSNERLQANFKPQVED